MSTHLKVLILDDDPKSVDLLSPEVRGAGYEPEWSRVDQKKDYLATFNDPPDLILAKYDLPKLSAPTALKSIQKKGLNIPFIIISEKSTEKEAIECLWQGADNYILKDHLSRLGPAISQALDKKSILESKQKSDQAVLASQDRYRSLFDSVPVGLYRTKIDGTIVDVNPAMVEIFGFPDVETFISTNVTSLYIDLKDRDKFKKILKKEGVIRNIEYPQKDYDGNIIWVEDSSRVVYDDEGNQLYYEGSIRDITQRKEAEQSLKASEEQFRSVVETALDAIVSSDGRGNIVFWNEAAEEIFQYKAYEIIGTPITKIIPGRFIKDHRTAFKRAAKKGALASPNHNYSVFGLRKSGEEFPIELSLAQWKSNEDVFFTAIIKDVSDQTIAEQAIKESEKLLGNIIESMNDGVLGLDKNFHYIFWNRKMELISKVPREELIGTGKRPWDVFPDLVEAGVDKMMQEAMAGKTVRRENIPYHYPDGTEGFTSDIFLPMYDQKGEINGIIGVIRETSELLKAEEALRQSEERYRTIFDASRAANYLSSANGQILDANQTMLDIFGYSKDEILKINFKNLFQQTRDVKIFEKQVNSEGFANDFEVKLIRQDKSLFDAEITTTQRKNDSGELIGYQGLIRDVTGRKLGERELEVRANVSAALRTAEERTALLSIILDQVLDIVDADGAALALIDVTGKVIIEQGRRIWESWSKGEVDPIKQISTQILAGGKPYISSNINKDPLLKNVEEFHGLQAVACIPLIAQENRVGLIWIGCKTNFSDEPIRLLTVISNIVANELHRTNLVEELERALNESQAVAEIGRELIRTLDLPKIFELIVKAAVNIIPNVNRSIIHIYNEKSQLLHPVAISSNNPSFIPINFPEIKVSETGEFNFDVLGTTDLRASSMSVGKGIAGTVISEGKTIIVNDTLNDPRYETFSSKSDIHAMIVVPVLSGEKRLGTLSVMGHISNAFSPADQNLLEQLSVQATTAIENARLYEAERIQRELTEARAEIAAAINKSIELDDVLNLILDQTKRVVPSETANIMLLDDKSIQLAGETSQEDTTVTKYGPEPSDKASSEITPILMEMIETRQPVIINDTSEDSRWIPNQDVLWIKSYAGIPLLVGEQLLGFLNLDHNIPDFFTDRTVQRLRAFADDAAIAVNNARLYREIENSLKQEKATRTQLLQSDKMAGMGRMVASVAHELNNPLQTIKNCLFLLEQDMTIDENADLFGTALSEVERLSNIVDRLREVYRPKLEDTIEPTTIKTLLADVQMLVEVHLKRKNVIWIQEPSDKNYVISGIADQLKQVFINLSLNAIEAMQPDGGNLTVNVFPSEDEDQICISFLDSGPGISPDFIQYVFDPFFTTKETGMGLGLSICYDIVENHNGKITVINDRPQGAVFTVWLPLQSIEELDVIPGD